MRATAGRIVHYQDELLPLDPSVALVVTVSSASVGLQVFGGDGSIDYVTDVPYAEVPTNGHWNWPPRV